MAHVGVLLTLAAAAAQLTQQAVAALLHRQDYGDDVHGRFASFIKKHGRTYEPGSEEYSSRLAAFAGSAAAVDHQNRKRDRTWTAAINQYSDWHPEELKQLRGRVGRARSDSSRISLLSTSSVVTAAVRKSLPKKITWDHLQAFQPDAVMSQGHCGSCWAVSTAVAMRARAEMAGNDRTFSVQQLVDCTPNDDRCGGDGACAGATSELAMAYVLSVSSVASEDDYPYQGVNGQCAPGRKPHANLVASTLSGGFKTSAGLSNYQTLAENRYKPVLEALQRGPVVASVWANDHWTHYYSGIMNCGDEPDGNPDVIINHAVVLYGYGVTEDGTLYWLIQNSWGPQWGEEGSVRLLRKDNDEERCFDDNDPLKGTGCAQGPHKSPASVRVCGECGVLYDVTEPIFPSANRTVRRH